MPGGAGPLGSGASEDGGGKLLGGGKDDGGGNPVGGGKLDGGGKLLGGGNDDGGASGPLAPPFGGITGLPGGARSCPPCWTGWTASTLAELGGGPRGGAFAIPLGGIPAGSPAAAYGARPRDSCIICC